MAVEIWPWIITNTSRKQNSNELGAKFFSEWEWLGSWYKLWVVSGVYLKEAKIFEWGMRKIRWMWHDKQGWYLFYLLALGVTGHKG